MNTVKMKLPVIKKSGGWYQNEGNIEVSYESLDLTEAVAKAKEQANKVLADLTAEVLAVESLAEVHELIGKANNRLKDIEKKRETAQRHFDALMSFLGRFGVDGKTYHEELRIASQPILEASAAENSEASDDDDDDDDDDLPL